MSSTRSEDWPRYEEHRIRLPSSRSISPISPFSFLSCFARPQPPRYIVPCIRFMEGLHSPENNGYDPFPCSPESPLCLCIPPPPTRSSERAPLSTLDNFHPTIYHYLNERPASSQQLTRMFLPIHHVPLAFFSSLSPVPVAHRYAFFPLSIHPSLFHSRAPFSFSHHLAFGPTSFSLTHAPSALVTHDIFSSLSIIRCLVPGAVTTTTTKDAADSLRDDG